VIGGQTTGREDAMDMGMKLELAGTGDEIRTHERTQGAALRQGLSRGVRPETSPQNVSYNAAAPNPKLEIHAD
jgi:hypothetical protein